MEIKRENLPKSKVKLTVKVTSSEMRQIFAKVYNKMAASVEVKGFRAGAAPKSLTISAIGEQRLNNEIINQALQDTYVEALKKENIVPIAPPRVNIKMLKDLTVDTAEMEYEAEIDLLPEVKLGDYKKIKVKKAQKPEIKKDEVEHVLSHLARSNAEFKEIDRSVKEGDRVELNFEGFDKGVKIENLSSKNYPVILGSNVLIPEFEKEIVGLKKSDKKDFSIEMSVPEVPTAADKKSPQDKKIDFKVEVLQTQEVILPKIDDEFAKKFQKKDLKDLKDAIEKDILKQKEMEASQATENEVLDSLLKITDVDVSESLVDQEVERQVQGMQARVSSMGLTFEQYLQNMKKTPEEFRKEIRPQAERIIKIGLALGEVVKREGIDPKDKQAGQLALQKVLEYANKNSK